MQITADEKNIIIISGSAPLPVADFSLDIPKLIS